MAAPTLIASYFVQQNINATTPLTTPSFTPSNGEVIIVKLGTWDSGTSMGTPTGGSQTYTSRVIVAPGGFRPWVGIYTATISGSPGSMTISSTPSASARYSMTVERWSGATLAGTPVTNGTNGAPGSAQSTLTTSAANSIVSWVAGDAQSLDPATRAYLSSATDEGLRDGHSGANGVEYFAYQVATSAGSQSYGLSAPTGMQWCIAGIEVLAASGATTVNGSAALTAQSTLTSGSLVTKFPSSALTAQSTLTSGSLVTKFPSSALTSQSVLTSSGIVSRLGGSVLTAQSVLTVSGTVTGTSVSANLSGQSTLTVTGSVTELVASALSGQSVLTVSGLVTKLGIAALSGQSTLTANAIDLINGAIALSSQSNLTASGVAGFVLSLNSQSSLIVSGTITKLGSASLTSDLSLNTSGKASVFATGPLSSGTTLIATGTVTKLGASALNIQSALSVSGFIPVVYNGSAILSITSNLVASGQSNPPWVFALIEFAAVDIKNTFEVISDNASFEASSTGTVGIEGG